MSRPDVCPVSCFYNFDMANKVHPRLASLSLDRSENSEPLSEQLYKVICSLIESGNLLANDPLPSSRQLSDLLDVSRSTVSHVYKQLTEEGLINSRKGSGTFVSETADALTELSTDSANAHSPLRLAELPASARVASDARSFSVQKNLPFAVIAPDHESLPGKNWTTIVSRISRSPWLHNGYCEPGGFMPYKEAVADYLRRFRGISCSADQVIATTGIQQALDLCASVLFKASDLVAVEDPYFQPHVNLLEFRGLKPVPIPVTQDGIDTDCLEKHSDIRGVLVTPCHQYPLGYVFSSQTREKLLDWAAKNSAWIIEDDYDSELRYGKKPHPALASLDQNECCIYLGSFTKVIYPGFNMGYMVVPKPLIRVFEGAKFLTDRHSSEVHQCILAEFIERGFYDSHVRRLKTMYEKRRQALVRSIGRLLGRYGSIEGENEGTHVTFLFNHPVNDIEICRFLDEKYRIEARPLSECYRLANSRSGLILGYAHFTEDELREAVSRLRDGLEVFFNR